MNSSPPSSLLSPKALSDMLSLATDTPPRGCFVELGVYQGGSAWHLDILAHAQGRKLHLFDTFNGIPERSVLDDVHSVGDFSDTTYAAVKALIPRAHFHVGVFPNSIPAYMEPIAFAHIDCDQYLTCMSAIRTFYPMLLKGGIMLFDDYGCTSGVTRAVEESFSSGFNLTPHGKAIAIR